MKEFVDYEVMSSICNKYFSEVVTDYTNTAILLNASDIALKRYRNEPRIIGLSTIENIPIELRYPTDVDYRFKREELVEKYKKEIPKKIGIDYLIRCVSTIDAFLEDLYEYLLKINNSEITESEIKKKVRAAWSNNNIINFFIQDFQIIKPSKKQSTPDMAFAAYECWREIRHAYVHNKGKLGLKHIKKLQELENRLPKESHMLKSRVIRGNKIVMDYASILVLRYWTYGFVSYIDYSLHNTIVVAALIAAKESNNKVELKLKTKRTTVNKQGFINTINLDKEVLVLTNVGNVQINDIKKVHIMEN
ncbi:hypothetical protein ABE65_016225 [Fictibacillus phosphorivorans]|uniref:Uncharacterized protein n=1 Tax=Fictibacillus phosphorivorans TaxID=1221500 RepID=A0A160IQZ3_9BACL|nr:hypothetical protein [Fictibacillus phosphorivorans]ANC78262.1 hypothetical protein ABE65_016225 [Fictibacillus phosphorivorans]